MCWRGAGGGLHAGAGGTHPNEPSGLVAAVLLIENAQPEAGTLYVIPRTNNSAFTCTDPPGGGPMRFTIDTPNGERWFRFGSRATNPIHQWPDPEIYVHASSGQRLSGPRPGISTAPTRAYRWHFHRENELRRDPAH